MKVLDRVGAEINPGDFVVYVTAGDRHPVLEFGWVLEFRESMSYGSPSGNFKIRIQRAEPDGTRKTVEAVDVAGHWRADAPAHCTDYRLNNYKGASHEEWETYYVQATFRDTGKPDTTALDISLKNKNNRLLVTKPV